MAAQGTDGLQVLVAQHFERLDKILTNTIKQLEELRACIPVGLKFMEGEKYYTEESGIPTEGYAVTTAEPVSWEAIAVGNADHMARVADALDRLNQGMPVLCCTSNKPCAKHLSLSVITPAQPHTSDGNCVCDGVTPE